MSQEIILHHYWPSPVAHKVRTVLGLKQLSWQSVEIPRIPPKPDLVALTGDYRRTPVMQIGADIYCDSHCIINELEKRFPGSLDPGNRTSHYGFSRWTDGEIFTHAIRIVIGSQVDTIDPDFLADRARLYFGPDWSAQSMAVGVTHSLVQFRTALASMEQTLAQGNSAINGDQLSLSDVYFYYLLWFVRGRYEHGPAMIDEFPLVSEFEKRVEALGHGTETDLDSKQAIEIAMKSEPQDQFPEHTGTNLEPLAASLPQVDNDVSVVPDGDGGDPEVSGKLIHLDSDEIVLRRTLSHNGKESELNVHFPTTGYVLSRKSPT